MTSRTTSTGPTVERGSGHEADDLLTIAEAAAMIRTPIATMRYWRYLGTGPRSFRLGRHVWYRASDIDAWIREQRDADESANPPR
jgi:predicted DNA-binding transcriptional regulator AlpA